MKIRRKLILVQYFKKTLLENEMNLRECLCTFSKYHEETNDFNFFQMKVFHTL